MRIKLLTLITVINFYTLLAQSKTNPKMESKKVKIEILSLHAFWVCSNR